MPLYPRFFTALMIALFFAGCGSTVRGVGKDISRVGRGVKMIFISEENEPAPEETKPSFADFFKTDKSVPERKR